MTQAKQKTILVVDDEESVRDSLSNLLEREGYGVFTAHSAEEGLEVLREEKVQLVISDHNMPGGMNGVEFLKTVRDRYPNVLRIMLTGEPDPAVIIRSINEGEVYRFLRKPWDNTMLRVTVYFAFETIQLEDENRRLLSALRRQMSMINQLQQEFPYLSALARDEEADMLIAQADLLAREGA